MSAKALKIETTSHNQQDVEHDFAVSARTSIARKSASLPLKTLIQQGRVPEASCLNFGKGRCDHDSNAIKAVSGNCTDYDYTYCRANIFGSHFGFVYAGYVQNTLPPVSRDVVWAQLARVTAQNGVCYVAVRSDKIQGEPHLDGVITSIGTFQKSYQEGDLTAEASRYFVNVKETRYAGFRMVECRHLKDNVMSLF